MKKKSLFFIAMTVALATVVNLFAGVVAFADDAAVIEIDTVEELKTVKNDLAGNYKLTANINLGGAEWTPIGSVTNDDTAGAFTGTFDGNGYTVYNFKVTVGEVTKNDRYGFFGSINNATVKNLRLAKATYEITSSTAAGVGAIVGRMYSGTVSGCETAADVTIQDGCGAKNHRNGGLIAYQGGGTVEYCVNRANVTASNSVQFYNGGIVGGIHGGTIRYCVNYGNITSAQGKQWSGIGGIAGQLDNWTGGTVAEISNCINYGTVAYAHENSTNSYAGGIVGQCKGAQSRKLNNNFNFGDIYTYHTEDLDDSAEGELHILKAQILGWESAAPSEATGNYGVSGNGNMKFAQQYKDGKASSPLHAVVLDTEANLKANATYKAIVAAVNATLGVSTDLYGYQTTKAVDSKFDLRLVATLSGDYTTLANVGFAVSVSYNLDGAQVKETNKTVTKLYNSITATNAGEESVTEHTATSLGGDYIFVLACKGLPANATDITFTVTTFYTVDAQAPVNSEVETFVVTIPNDTLPNA